MSGQDEGEELDVHKLTGWRLRTDPKLPPQALILQMLSPAEGATRAYLVHADDAERMSQELQKCVAWMRRKLL